MALVLANVPLPEFVSAFEGLTGDFRILDKSVTKTNLLKNGRPLHAGNDGKLSFMLNRFVNAILDVILDADAGV